MHSWQGLGDKEISLLGDTAFATECMVQTNCRTSARGLSTEGVVEGLDMIIK